MTRSIVFDPETSAFRRVGPSSIAILGASETAAAVAGLHWQDLDDFGELEDMSRQHAAGISSVLEPDHDYGPEPEPELDGRLAVVADTVSGHVDGLPKDMPWGTLVPLALAIGKALPARVVPGASRIPPTWMFVARLAGEGALSLADGVWWIGVSRLHLGRDGNPCAEPCPVGEGFAGEESEFWTLLENGLQEWTPAGIAVVDLHDDRPEALEAAVRHGVASWTAGRKAVPVPDIVALPAESVFERVAPGAVPALKRWPDNIDETMQPVHVALANGAVAVANLYWHGTPSVDGRDVPGGDEDDGSALYLADCSPEMPWEAVALAEMAVETGAEIEASVDSLAPPNVGAAFLAWAGRGPSHSGRDRLGRARSGPAFATFGPVWAMLPEIVDPGSGSGGPTFPLAALMAAALSRRELPRQTGGPGGRGDRDVTEWRLIVRLSGEGAFPQCWWAGSATLDVTGAEPVMSIVTEERPEIFFEPRYERLFAHQAEMLELLESFDSTRGDGYALVDLGEPPQRGDVGDGDGAALQLVRESLVESIHWSCNDMNPIVVELSRAEIDAAAKAPGVAQFRVAA